MSATSAEESGATGNGLDDFARRHFRRNAAMLGIENAGFLVAIAFVGSTTVLPTFVTQLGGSSFLVGLIATFQTAGWLLPQLVGASLCAGKRRMMPYILGPFFVGRPAFLVVGAAALIFGARQPWVLIAILYVGLILFYVTDALASVPWFELIGRTIPPDRRGRLWGGAQVLGGLGGMAVGALVGEILGRPDLPFPSNYAVLFLLSGVIFLVNLVPFLAVVEPDFASVHPSLGATSSVRQFVGMLLPILRRDANFVRLIGARLLFGAVAGTFSFYVLYVARDFSLGPERLGLFVSAQVFGGLIGGLVIGWVADQVGTKTVMRLSSVVGASVPALGLAMLTLRGASGDLVLYAGAGLFALIGLASSSSLIGFTNYLLEVAPLDLRSTYVGLFNTLSGVLLVVPPLAGWYLVNGSFAALFAATIVGAALCLLVTIGLRQPDRSRTGGT